MRRVRDFFPLGSRPVVTVKETADGRSSEGEQRVGSSEIGAQCAIRKSAPSSTVIREGPPISVRPPRQGAPRVPVQMFPVGPAQGVCLEGYLSKRLAPF